MSIAIGGDETGALVGDVGSAVSKFGFGGEDAPKCVFDSALGCVGGSESRGLEIDADLPPLDATTYGNGVETKTSNLSSSVTSKSIRLIFGRIDCPRRVLEAQQKSVRRNGRIFPH